MTSKVDSLDWDNAPVIYMLNFAYALTQLGNEYNAHQARFTDNSSEITVGPTLNDAPFRDAEVAKDWLRAYAGSADATR